MERVKSGLWVQALLWRLDRQALAVAIRKRGDADSGSILLKITNLSGGVQVLSQVQDGAGNSVWMRATGADLVSEDKAESYIQRSLSIDPDQWVLEIEDPKGRFHLDERIL
jgi:hypothetical protein